MGNRLGRIVHWAPRLLGIAFALFVSLFVLDVLEEPRERAPAALALLMHLLPTGIVLAALAVSWRRSWAGAILFLTLGLLYVARGWGRMHWSAHLAIAGPLLLAGTLFLIDWRHTAATRGDPGALP